MGFAVVICLPLAQERAVRLGSVDWSWGRSGWVGLLGEPWSQKMNVWTMQARRTVWNRSPLKHYPEEALSCLIREVAPNEKNVKTEGLWPREPTQKPAIVWITPISLQLLAWSVPEPLSACLLPQSLGQCPWPAIPLIRGTLILDLEHLIASRSSHMSSPPASQGWCDPAMDFDSCFGKWFLSSVSGF